MNWYLWIVSIFQILIPILCSIYNNNLSSSINDLNLFTVLWEKSDEIQCLFREKKIIYQIFEKDLNSSISKALDEIVGIPMFKYDLSIGISLCNDPGESDYYYNDSQPFEMSAVEDKSFRKSGIFIFLHDLTNLATFIDCLTPPKILAMIIVTDVIDAQLVKNEFMLLMVKHWNIARTYEIFLLHQMDLLMFNPFAINGDEFGSLVALTNHNISFIETMMNNLNGYPLAIELFSSAYSLVLSSNVLARNRSETIEDATNSILVGTDPEVLYLLREAMNFTVAYQHADQDSFGYRLANGSFTGVLKRLINRESDIVVTGYFIKDYYSNQIDFTVAAYSDQLCCYVQKAGRIPPSVLPLVCFTPLMWFSFFICTVICGIVWMILRDLSARISKDVDKEIRKRRIIIMVETFGLMLSAPLNGFSKIKTQRVFILSICLLSLVFTALFQSSLATVFIQPIYYKDISDLRELDESGLPIIIKYQAMLDDLFPPNVSSYMDSLRNKLSLSSSKESLSKIIAEFGKISGSTRESQVYLENNYWYISNQLFLIPECPKTYNLAYVVPASSVFLSRFNAVLLRICEGGFIEKFTNDMKFNATMNTIRTQGTLTDQAVYKSFTIVDLQLPFYILLIGYVISGILFILERFKFKKVQSNQQLIIK